MASILHLGAGAACGAVYARATGSPEPARAIVGGALLGVSPDLDLLTLYFGGLGTPLEHRIATHSLLVAGVMGCLIGYLLPPRRDRRLAMAVAVAALASHGLLDAMTLSEPGPQLLWPLWAEPVVFSWRPIPGLVSFQHYFSLTGLPVLLWEAVFSAPLWGATVYLVAGGQGAASSPDRSASLIRE